ncbi:PTS sugar transporter subunit IIB [Lactobacillus sp. ESL0679]|uniref:PTS sugar transporter subunit IIB n=1 Tax=Lactobacillus sp. ESL0679 TaxID=2983209 RepID=UPI0023F64AA0|nr:PTS sugar transporter subunit IIB [Lactobacillus sp. ESL0679]MDF7683557.1 PTS sugar transporter subunit IIB [Lactobacillus sp. ESL0679]
MANPNIVAVRLDERLIHGQGRLWISNLGANLVIVANDEVAQSSIQQTLMKSLLPNSIGVRFFTIEETIDKIFKAAPRQKIFIIVKTAEDTLKLAKGGVPFKKLNVGNIHFKEGKTKVTNYISVDENDMQALKEMRDEYQIDFNTRVTPIGNEVGSDFNLNQYVDNWKGEK